MDLGSHGMLRIHMEPYNDRFRLALKTGIVWDGSHFAWKIEEPCKIICNYH